MSKSVTTSTPAKQNLYSIFEKAAASAPSFTACAWFDPVMDQLTYLVEDVSYTADRFDEALTLLWHPHDSGRLVGLKLKGFRQLYDTLVEMGLMQDSFIDLITVVMMHREMYGRQQLANYQRDHGPGRVAKYRQMIDLARHADHVPMRVAA